MLPVLVQPCPPNTTLKKIHFIRHGHGKHNEVGEIDKTQYFREDLIDAELTDLGIEQCIQLCNENQRFCNSELLVVSPMRRTLQTAALSFPNLVNQIPWVALECIREQTGLHPCDKRFPISHHQNNHPNVDFNHIQHDEDPMYDFYSAYREPDSDLDERAKQFLSWLESRTESEIIVVTHSAFLRGLFRRVLFPQEKYQEFSNCEARTFLLHYSIPKQQETSSSPESS